MKSILFSLAFFINCLAPVSEDKGINKYSIKIWDSNYSMSFTILYAITDDSLIVKRLSGITKEKDKTLVKRLLRSNERKIFLDYFSFLNIDSLKNEYKNPLIEDGDRKRVMIQLNNKQSKTIDIANCYQKDLASLFNLVNQIVSPELKIIYTDSNK